MVSGGRSSGNWVFGLIILIIGIIFLVENLIGMEIWDKVWLFWPFLLMLWGLVELFQKKSIFFGIILLGLGILFLAKNLDLFQWSESIWKFWPIIIIAIGIDQLFKKTEEPTILKSNMKKQKGKKEMITQEDEII